MSNEEPTTEHIVHENVSNIWELTDEGESNVSGNSILERARNLVQPQGGEEPTLPTLDYVLEDYVSLLCACQKVSLWRSTSPQQLKMTMNSILQAMRRNNVFPNEKAYSVVMGSFIKCRSPMIPIEFWNEMLREGIEPDMVSCSIVLNSYCKAIGAGLTGEQAINKTWEMLKKMDEFNLVPEQTFLSILLNVMSRAHSRKNFDLALKVIGTYGYKFHEGIAMDIILRTAVNFQDPHLGFEWFSKALENGYLPNSEGVDKLLTLCDMLRKKDKCSIDIFCKLLDTMLKLNNRGAFFQIENVFWNLHIRPNTAIWNVLINGCGQFRNMISLHTLLNEMRENGDMPNTETLSNVLNACYRHNDMKAALQIFNTMRRDENVEINSEHFKTLFDLAAKLHDEQNFDKISRMLDQANLPRSVPLVAAIIRGNAKLERLKAAMELYDAVVGKDDMLDVQFFNSALFACKTATNLPRAREIFAQMQGRGVLPNEDTCHLMLDIMVKCDVSDEECEEFILEMRDKFGIHIETTDANTTNVPQPSDVFSMRLDDDDYDGSGGGGSSSQV